jgi:hypothetical protein
MAASGGELQVSIKPRPCKTDDFIKTCKRPDGAPGYPWLETFELLNRATEWKPSVCRPILRSTGCPENHLSRSEDPARFRPYGVQVIIVIAKDSQAGSGVEDVFREQLDMRRVVQVGEVNP